MEELSNKVIGNFWMAIVASVILVATAMLLKDDINATYVIIGELSFFGIRGIDQIIKSYMIGKSNPTNLKV